MKKIILLFALICIIETGHSQEKNKTALIADSLKRSLKIESQMIKDTLLQEQNIQYRYIKITKDSLMNKKIQNATTKSIKKDQLKDMVMIEKKEITNSNRSYQERKWGKMSN